MDSRGEHEGFREGECAGVESLKRDRHPRKAPPGDSDCLPPGRSLHNARLLVVIHIEGDICEGSSDEVEMNDAYRAKILMIK